jgi:hypothetical protein
MALILLPESFDQTIDRRFQEFLHVLESRIVLGVGIWHRLTGLNPKIEISHHEDFSRERIFGTQAQNV